jgi:hypothetical protein
MGKRDGKQLSVCSPSEVSLSILKITDAAHDRDFSDSIPQQRMWLRTAIYLDDELSLRAALRESAWKRLERWPGVEPTSPWRYAIR